MTKEEKVKKYIEKNNLTEQVEINIYEFSFVINRTPENYVRERKGKGNHFYNPKEEKMREYKIECLKQLTKEQKETINNVIKSGNHYEVSITATYYYPIPKGTSIKASALMEEGIISPTIRIDLDNYDKFLLDSLHDVVYDDDKHVVGINSRKAYSLSPKTIVRIYFKEIKIVK